MQETEHQVEAREQITNINLPTVRRAVSLLEEYISKTNPDKEVYRDNDFLIG